MRITSNYSVSNNTKVSNISLKKEKTLTLQTLPNISREYNPLYYKPVAFKGAEFEVYFPEKILGISEAELDSMLCNVYKDNKKRNELAEYIAGFAAKDSRVMNFINTWKAPVPSLLSQEIIMSAGVGDPNFLDKLGRIAVRNNANKSISKFLYSDFQSDILMKDMKKVAGPVAVFSVIQGLNEFNPEPQTRGAILAFTLIMSSISYKLASNDTEKIQNKQFNFAIKEMIKLGIVDPYLLINKIDSSKVQLSKEKQDEYIKWREGRISDVRYQRTGKRKDTKNDFSLPEVRKSLDIWLKVLQDNLGFDCPRVIATLQLLAAQYMTIGDSREAEFIIQKALDTWNAYESHVEPDKYVKTYNALTYSLASLKRVNEKPKEAYDLFDIVTSTSDNNEYLVPSMINMFELLHEEHEKYEKISPLLKADRELAVTEERKQRLHNAEYKSDRNAEFLDELANRVLQLRLGDAITDNEFKQLLAMIGKTPYKYKLFDVTYTDTYWDKKPKSVIPSRLHCASDSVLISHPMIFDLIEDEVMANDVAIADHKNNAQILLGISALRAGHLESLINDILEKQRGEFTKTDVEILKIAAKDYYNSLMTPEEFGKMIQAGKNLGNSLWNGLAISMPDEEGFVQSDEGDSIPTEKKYAWVHECALVQVDPFVNSYDVAFFKNAPKHIQDKYLPDLYAQYAMNQQRFLHLRYGKNLNGGYPGDKISIAEITDILTSYVKYFEHSDKIEDIVMFKFLELLDLIYKEGFFNDKQTSKLRAYTVLADIQDPELDADVQKAKKLLSWTSYEDDQLLHKWIQKCPGIFRVNERKYIDLVKKYEVVWFEERHKSKMNSKLREIERVLGVPDYIYNP